MAAAAVVLSPVTTPVDYHRIVSPRLTIPTDTTKPIPVGLLSCQRDPLLHRIETSVVDVFPLQEGAPQKPPRKGAKVPRSEGAVLRIILHDTIIFPEGGGQPSDVGFISVGSDHTFEVFEAKRVGGHAVHSIRFPTPDELQKAQLLLLVGTDVVVTLGDDGHRRRLDHMTLHTSQHLLSAVIEQRLQLPTLSWSHTVSQVTEERFTAYGHRNDDPLSFLGAVAWEFAELWTASERASKRYLIALTSSPTSQTVTSSTLVLVFGSEDVGVKEVGERLKLELGVKGGGKGPRWSGKWTGVWKPVKEGELVGKVVRGNPV